MAIRQHIMTLSISGYTFGQTVKSPALNPKGDSPLCQYGMRQRPNDQRSSPKRFKFLKNSWNKSHPTFVNYLSSPAPNPGGVQPTAPFMLPRAFCTLPIHELIVCWKSIQRPVPRRNFNCFSCCQKYLNSIFSAVSFEAETRPVDLSITRESE